MIKSMTGYGRGEVSDKGFYIVVEMRSVNHRFLDITCRCSKIISSLEDRVRSFISDKISRGKIDVNISFEMPEGSMNKVNIDEILLKQYMNVFTEAKNSFGLEGNIKISDIILLPEVVKIKNLEIDIEEIWINLKKALEDSINKLIDMRVKEGIKLYNDLVFRLDKIERSVNEIEETSPKILDEYKVRFETRIKELAQDKVDQNRIMTEIAIFIDKACIAEEITRLKSHLIQFKESIKEDIAVGKKLDFIIQELNREANTLGSKSIDYKISKCVIELKNDIEKLREQVQNIE
ncbi:MAG: YicC/YloC family endoribonuclease [Thermoanaerobacteraceae bacterium]